MKALLVSANTEQTDMPAKPLGLACVAAAAGNAGQRPPEALPVALLIGCRSVWSWVGWAWVLQVKLVQIPRLLPKIVGS